MSEQEIVIGGDAADIPNGIYPAKVDRIEVLNSTKYDSDFRAWTFRLDGGSEVSGSTSMATGSKSKAGKWIKALLGRKPEKNERVRLNGLPCLVVVEEDDNGWPRAVDVLPPVSAKGSGASEDDPSASEVAVTSNDLPF